MSAFRTKWNNEFDSVNEMYKRRNLSKTEQDEMKIIKKANILVSYLEYE